MSAVALPEPVDQSATGDVVAARRPRDKWLACGISLVMMLAVLSPIVENWRDRPRDSFPLSYYPMFSQRRPDAQRETYLVGWDGQGNRFLIDHSYAGTGGIVRVRRTIVQGMTRRGQAAELCRSVSSTIARRNQPELRPITTVQVVTGTYRRSEYFTGNKAPDSEQVHATCKVERGRT